MADVYLATDTQRAVSVALKVMRAELSLDEYFETYFQREASVLQQLQHPNIVRLYELVRDGNLLFLVMDYITGPTLQQHLFTKKLLPTSDAILIARSLATALDFAHSKGVIHRDLKPSNVLLADHGAILLSDFGVARVAGSVTTAASRMGTLAYMSPEQITGGELTPAADQYSLGILLWELLTGRRPFVGETPGLAAGPLGERVMEEHLKYPPPTGVLPADMFPVLVRTLAKHARQRFPTCLDMVNQLITNTGVQPTSAKHWNRKIDDFDSAPTQPPPIALPKPGIGVIATPEHSAAHKPDSNLDAAPRSTSRKVTQQNSGETKDAGASGVRTTRFVQAKVYGPSSYTGELKDDKRNGQGTLTYADGSSYIGTWKTDKRNGQGTLTFANGNTYTGEFKEDKFNGHGTLRWVDGATYTGEFKDGKYNGHGTSKYPDGHTYTGAFTDNSRNGQGTATDKDGTTYTGAFKDGERHGQGTLTAPDGTTYTGEFRDGNPIGQGTVLSADGGAIATPEKSIAHKHDLNLGAAPRSTSRKVTQQNSGETKDAGASGVRTTRFVQAKRYGDSSYTGELEDGKRTGQGTLRSADGSSYIGTWKDDMRHGQGTETKADGTTYTGEFREGNPTGQGIVLPPKVIAIPTPEKSGAHTITRGGVMEQQPAPQDHAPAPKMGNVNRMGLVLLVLLILVLILVPVAPSLFTDTILSAVWLLNFLVFVISIPLIFINKKTRLAFIFALVLASISMGRINYEQVNGENNRRLSAAFATSAAAPTSTSTPTATAGPTDVPTGTKIFLNKGHYTGELRDSMANGQGTAKYANGDTYTGEWRDDKHNGQGTLTYANGDKYTGEFKDDNQNGQGTYTWTDGATYTGEYKDGARHGQGTETYADGDMYTGEWKDDARNGQGTYTFADGATYTGEYKDDQPNGQGSETDKLGATTYIGLFENGKHAVATAVALVPATATPAIAKPANTMAAPTEAPVVAPTAAPPIEPTTAPTAVVAAAPAPAPQSGRDAVLAILLANARTRWGDNGTMVQFSYNQQIQAYDWVVAQTDYPEIMVSSQTKWDTDYVMVKFNYTKEVEAYTWVNSQTEYADIMSSARNKWGTEYSMVKYSYTKEVEAFLWLNAQTGHPDIMQNARNKWGTEYSMVKYEYQKQVP